MGAPKGNQFYKYRKTSGAPLKYTAEMLQDFWNEYLDWCQNSTVHKRKELIRSGEMAGQIVEIPLEQPLTLDGFCLFSGISYQTIKGYCSEECEKTDNDLFQISTYICNSIDNYLLTGAYNNTLNPGIVARKLGLNDTINITTEQPVVNINLNALTGKNNKSLNENNIEDIEFTELDPIELSQNNTSLTDINTSELQTNVNE